MRTTKIDHAGGWWTNRTGAISRAERVVGSGYDLCLGESAPERAGWNCLSDTGVSSGVGEIVHLIPTS
jgi:hypothetical protein